MYNFRVENGSEVTAEWSVHAQLTISHPTVAAGKSEEKEDQKQEEDPSATSKGKDCGNKENPEPEPKPITVIYQWSTEDDPNRNAALGNLGGIRKGNVVFKKTEKECANSSSNDPDNNTCKSTCSLVLSTCSDLLYELGDTLKKNHSQLQANETQIFRITPDRVTRKDAFSQTSPFDYERVETPTTSTTSTRNTESTIKRKPSQKVYDYRRMTESLLSPPQSFKLDDNFDRVEDFGSSFGPWANFGRDYQMPAQSAIAAASGAATMSEGRTLSSPRSRLSRSPANSRRSPNPSQSNRLQKSSSNKQMKPPRTVHIDVYCTGSDADSDSSEDNLSTSISSKELSGTNAPDIESTSTRQTVFESQDMKLRHRRASKEDVPRKLATDLSNKSKGKTLIGENKVSIKRAPKLASLNRENILKYLSRSNSKDEISESKQILFDKHLGGDGSSLKGLEDNLNKEKPLTQINPVGNVVHDTSDGCISSNYPNSSFSTFLDNTFSSFSSTAATPQIFMEDLESATSSSFKETTISNLTTLTQGLLERTDSIDVEEIQKEPVKIKRKEKVWGQPNVSNVERKFMLQQKKMIDYFKQKETSEKWQKSYSLESNSDVSNGVEVAKIMTVRQDSQDSSETKKVRKEKTPEKLVKSLIAEELAPKKLIIPITQETLKRPPPKSALLSHTTRDTESIASSLQSQMSGYTNEYLVRARKFGAVVTALRKPGHHIGPAKNPDCLCEHCTRYFRERNQGRGRAMSITNLTFDGFRARKIQQ